MLELLKRKAGERAQPMKARWEGKGRVGEELSSFQE
jgi:hypothetical protein